MGVLDFVIQKKKLEQQKITDANNMINQALEGIGQTIQNNNLLKTENKKLNIQKQNALISAKEKGMMLNNDGTIGFSDFQKTQRAAKTAKAGTEIQKAEVFQQWMDDPESLSDEQRRLLSIDEDFGDMTEQSLNEVKLRGELRKEKETLRKQKLTKTNLQESTRNSLKSIKEIRKGKEFFGIGASLPAIPSLQADKVKWRANFDKFKSTLVLDVMRDLKEASATGSTGFGQLSEKELKILTDASTALKATMSPEDAFEILDDMEVKFNKILSKDSEQQADDGENGEKSTLTKAEGALNRGLENLGSSSGGVGDFRTFTVNGTQYDIPFDKVAAFTKQLRGKADKTTNKSGKKTAKSAKQANLLANKAKVAIGKGVAVADKISDVAEGSKLFTVNGIKYNIPINEIIKFKNQMGL